VGRNETHVINGADLVHIATPPPPPDHCKTQPARRRVHISEIGDFSKLGVTGWGRRFRAICSAARHDTLTTV
jgi:hypothetical protein